MGRVITDWKSRCYLCGEDYKTVDMNTVGYGKEAIVICKKCGQIIFNFISVTAITTIERIKKEYNHESYSNDNI